MSSSSASRAIGEPVSTKHALVNAPVILVRRFAYS
jgi:hypothetical protein